MLRGLYTAASGMITETYRTDTISNNLANIDTTGYKKDTLVNEEFAPILLRRINDSAGGNDVTSFKGFSVGAEAPVVGRLGRGSIFPCAIASIIDCRLEPRPEASIPSMASDIKNPAFNDNFLTACNNLSYFKNWFTLFF